MKAIVSLGACRATRQIYVLLSCLVLALITVRGYAAPTMTVHSIDVGQGASTLLEFSCGAVLIDTGGESNYEFDGNDTLELYLEHFFERRSDLQKHIKSLILTHPHKDHTNGVKDVLATYQIEHIVTNGQISGSGRWGQIAAHKHALGPDKIEGTGDDVPFTWVRLEDLPHKAPLVGSSVDNISCTDLDPQIAILWGQVTTPRDWGKDRYGKPHYGNENNHSLAVRVRFGQRSMLITGDMEEVALKEFVTRYEGTSELDIDIYQTGHHGSANGTIESLTKAMTPKLALIHMGPYERQIEWTAWKYGHPRREVVALLERYVADTRPTITVNVGRGATKFQSKQLTKAIYATGWDGDIVLQASDAGVWKVIPAAGGPTPLNINTATLDQLLELPGIGTTRAQAILAYRTQQGRITDIRDLENVQGIGPVTSATLESLVSF